MYQLKRLLAAVCLAAPTLLAAWGSADAQQLVRGDPGIIGNTGLTTETGRRVRISDFHGKVVFINFWGSWCPPCIDEMASIRALQAELGNYQHDLAFVFISAKRETFDTDAAWLRRHGIGGQNYQWEPRVPEQRLAFFGALPGEDKFAVPTTYILDRDGQVAEFKSAPADWRAHLAHLRSLIATPLARAYLY